MTTTTIPTSIARESVLPVLAIAVALTWLGDFLFWPHPPGISVAIFAVFAAAALFNSVPGNGRSGRPAWIAVALLLLSSFATLVEISFSNIAALVALLAVIMGERHYRELASGWTRWSESLIAWVCAGGRWPWLARSIGESELANVGLNTVTSDRAAKSIQILAPAAALAVVFGVVLSFGNAVFRQLLTHLDVAVMNWVSSFDFSPVRFLLWAGFATFALALARPRPAPASPRLWTRAVPYFSRADTTIAVWQSCAVFVVLNALFFIVNTIDVVYLWGGSGRAALPEHVTYSEFVHEGVYSLIFAVLLSAVVIAFIFQQEGKVTRHRVLKILAWAWSAQNLVLIAGAFLRLKLYVDAYQMSELRVYVGCFLVLVTAGFGLLALHVAHGGNLGSLIWRNVIATFGLFFVVQFLDVAGWVARFNVAQWQQEPRRTLDLAYLESLGPGAWPALGELASSPGDEWPTVQKAREIVRRVAGSEIEYRGRLDWRSYQARRHENGARLIEAVRRLPAVL